jgi:hypothetical protein
VTEKSGREQLAHVETFPCFFFSFTSLHQMKASCCLLKLAADPVKLGVISLFNRLVAEEDVNIRLLWDILWG